MSEARGLKLDLARATRAWAPGPSRMRTWASAALGSRAEGREMAVRVVATRESRALNKLWRGKDQPTNVLSFPAPEAVSEQVRALRAGAGRAAPRTERLPLGDLVICADVVRREAERDGKRLQAHWAHMVVHGTLHLAGYDHEAGERERLRMERREIAVLKSFGYRNPYL
jgi:probable rRNA maturation factor